MQNSLTSAHGSRQKHKWNATLHDEVGDNIQGHKSATNEMDWRRSIANPW
jgi:hypothetical protein